MRALMASFGLRSGWPSLPQSSVSYRMMNVATMLHHSRGWPTTHNHQRLRLLQLIDREDPPLIVRHG